MYLRWDRSRSPSRTRRSGTPRPSPRCARIGADGVAVHQVPAVAVAGPPTVDCDAPAQVGRDQVDGGAHRTAHDVATGASLDVHTVAAVADRRDPAHARADGVIVHD